MAYNHQLANRVREALVDIPDLKIEEKKMFSGLAFMVNGKMCVNISGDGLMCRFDPTRHEEIAERNGYEPMVMRGQELKGYCYVNPDGFKIQNDFKFWLDICLDFNDRAKVSKKK